MIHALARHILGMDSQLLPETRDRIAALTMTEREFDARETIYRSGEKSDHIYVARSGWFAATLELKDGGRQLLNFYVPVDVMGLEFLMTGDAPTNLTALCPSSAVLLPRREFIDILQNQPLIMSQMMSILGLQDVLLQERLCAMSRMNARDKIAYFLLLLRSKVNAKSDEPAMIIRFPLTQTDIADSLGLTNVTVSRTITQLENAGYLKYSRNIIEFIKPQELALEVGFLDRYAKLNAVIRAMTPDRIAA